MVYDSPSIAVAERRGPRPGPGAERVRGLLEDHFRFIYRVIRRLGVHEAEVDDATQQVFIVANQNIDLIEQGKERAYLFATASRVAANARRSQRSRPKPDDVATSGSAASEAPSPEELLGDLQTRRLLDQALDALPTDLRTIFVLYELEELTSPQIAELTGLALGTVASRLRRARECFAEVAETLRRQLAEDEGGES